MQIVHRDEVPVISRRSRTREGVLHQADLLTGDPTKPGNFDLTQGKAEGEVYGNRHRHNFEQAKSDAGYEELGASDDDDSVDRCAQMAGHHGEGGAGGNS